MSTPGGVKVVAAILAGGKGTRFGADKTQIPLRGKPLWRYSFDTYASHPLVSGVGLVSSSSEGPDNALFVTKGGETRQQSARNALSHLPSDVDILLLHDAARPFVSRALITAVIEGVLRTGAAAPGVPVMDTIRVRENGSALDRSKLVAMQTPQGSRVELLQKAYNEVTEEFTDEVALLQAIGVQSEIVAGDHQNFKITTPEDLARAAAVLGQPELRTGIGYDIHPFDLESDKTLMLGGVAFEGERPLLGHSDADVLLHAVTDALLGAAGLGDIGQHFPNTDEEWRGRESIFFLKNAQRLLSEQGWRILNIDATVIAEFPKVMKKAEAIRDTISTALAIELKRVSIKATTNERLGSIGRGEGIAAFAVATLVEHP